MAGKADIFTSISRHVRLKTNTKKNTFPTSQGDRPYGGKRKPLFYRKPRPTADMEQIEIRHEAERIPEGDVRRGDKKRR